MAEEKRLAAGVRMVSRWNNKCMECGKPYARGETIEKMSTCSGDWAHAKCAEEARKPKA